MQEEHNDLLELLLLNTGKSHAETNIYGKFDLSHNPFPKSGTASINISDSLNKLLVPFDTSVKNTVRNYIYDSLYAKAGNNDKFLSATITGNYGSGKTQLLLYVKYLLGQASTVKNTDFPYRNPFVVYIDNPGVRLTELIGNIISKIGEEDFKKFIWGKIIADISSDDDYKRQLNVYAPKVGDAIFDNLNKDPFAVENTVNYKKFLDVFLMYLPVKKKKDFTDALRAIILQVLQKWKNDSTISNYFYDLTAEDYGNNKTWEILSQGSEKAFDKKEVDLLKTVVELVESQGFTDFYILVDEFEDLTEGRLSKTELDNYLRNLRTLIDQNRNWCPIFAMTDEALKKVRSVSPPLADRLTNRLIQLRGFDDNQAEYISTMYLNLARDDKSVYYNSLHPFTKDSIETLRKLVGANLRLYLKTSFELIERGIERFSTQQTLIESEFIQANFTDK